jgi:hypothetical protein
MLARQENNNHALSKPGQSHSSRDPKSKEYGQLRQLASARGLSTECLEKCGDYAKGGFIAGLSPTAQGH